MCLMTSLQLPFRTHSTHLVLSKAIKQQPILPGCLTLTVAHSSLFPEPVYPPWLFHSRLPGHTWQLLSSVTGDVPFLSSSVVLDPCQRVFQLWEADSQQLLSSAMKITHCYCSWFLTVKPYREAHVKLRSGNIQILPPTLCFRYS